MSLSNLPNRILVTGGAGFIGSAIIRSLLRNSETQILNFDKLTYAANRETLRGVSDSPNYQLVEADICNRETLRTTLQAFQPDAIIHAAAESHVDRSIQSSTEFIQTNIVGTYTLLETTRDYWDQLPTGRRQAFRFLHLSTGEVYGDLGKEGFFSEASPYSPRSPYSASKAASDHLAMSWYHTYGLPVLVTHCTNNFGPYQYPEKLIPHIILNALQEKPLPLYGTGDNIRDWLFVDDHAQAICLVLCSGKIGDTYNIGANNERTNLQIVQSVCRILDELQPRNAGKYEKLITFVQDRPGHDKRYAIDASKIATEIGWKPQIDLESGLRSTVQWYLENPWWWKPLRSTN